MPKLKLRKALGYSYYNAEKETPRALDPWYDHVDHIIAIDGRYKIPISPMMAKMKLSDYSTDNTEHVLKTKYGDKLTHEKLFTNQIEKRQRYLDIAGELGCDILIVFDSDDILHPDYQDWNLFDKQLEFATKYWKEEIYKMHCWLPDSVLWPKQHNATPDNIWKTYSRIHKNPGEQRYAKTHWTWTKKTNTDHELNMWEWAHPFASNDEHPLLLKDGPTIDGVRFTTNRLLRTPTDLEWGDGWAFQNMHWEAYHYKTEALAKHYKITSVFDHLKETKFPDLEYYFGLNSKLTAYHLNDKEEYIIVNADGSEDTLQEAYDKEQKEVKVKLDKLKEKYKKMNRTMPKSEEERIKADVIFAKP